MYPYTNTYAFTYTYELYLCYIANDDVEFTCDMQCAIVPKGATNRPHSTHSTEHSHIVICVPTCIYPVSRVDAMHVIIINVHYMSVLSCSCVDAFRTDDTTANLHAFASNFRKAAVRDSPHH